MEEKFYTARQFAEKLGVNRQSVYDWINKGLLKAEKKKIGDLTLILIPRKAVEKFQKPRMGRPKKKS
ncbi:helix-turn-helix domain-containing protein [Thermodesulfobacteriota bacterium]